LRAIFFSLGLFSQPLAAFIINKGLVLHVLVGQKVAFVGKEAVRELHTVPEDLGLPAQILDFLDLSFPSKLPGKQNLPGNEIPYQ
jgi:hypothetical protein